MTPACHASVRLNRLGEVAGRCQLSNDARPTLRLPLQQHFHGTALCDLDEPEESESIRQLARNMRLSWIVALTVAFLLILSLCATTVVSSTPSKEEKRFVFFHAAKVNTGSFINVPVNCPPDKIKIGNRCRAVF